MTIKRLFLLLGFFVVTGVALTYGADPAWYARIFLGITTLDVSLAHMLRAVMGLYIAMGLFWLASSVRGVGLNTAIVTVILFNGGLLIGRIISFALDGPPALLLQVFTGFELAVLPVAAWMLRIPEQPRSLP